MMTTDNLYPIMRFIYLSLAYSSGQKRLVRQHQEELTALVQRFQAQAEFRQAVETGLNAMELKLLGLEENGLRLSAQSAGGFFALTLTDYGKMLARSDLKAADVLCVHCAIATAFFPTEADLDAPVEDLGVIVVSDIVDLLRRFSRAEAQLAADDDRFHPQVRTVGERIRQLPEDNPDSCRSGAGNSWLDLIGRVVDHMVDTGYLLTIQDLPGELEYRSTPAYQSAIREGAVYTFHLFRDLIVEYEDNEASAASPQEAHVSA
jgi:hypothetical protein